MSIQEKTREIEELQQKLSILKEQRRKLNTKARKWAEERNKLNEQVKNLHVKIHELRNARDELNRRVQELKQLREDTTKAKNEKINEIKKMNQKIRALSKKKPLRSLRSLQEKMEKMEWQIQTSSLSLEEEKKLVNQVHQLAAQIDIHQRIGALHQKRHELQIELDATRTKNELYHNKLMETAQKSQEVHKKILEKTSKVKKIVAEADKMHKNFVNAKQSGKPIQDEIAKTLDKMKELETEIRKEEEEEKKKIEKALRKKIEKIAEEKMKLGKKLTWEEFKILSRNKKATQD